MRCIEDICIFYSKKPTYNPQGLIRLNKPIKNSVNKGTLYNWRGRQDSLQYYTNYPKHLLEFENEAFKGKRLHPTQKPVALLEYLIKTYTNEGKTVLDNCMGSGSTGVACVNTGRDFIGIELDKEYFNIAESRINEALFNLKQEV
jgi:site-specific DNA-methyltransferase (adenine-specific)